MTKLESIQDIKETALKLQQTLVGSDIAAIKIAETALIQLIDQFYKENKDMMAPPQHQAAKRDYAYFMRLVDLALAYYREED